MRSWGIIFWIGSILTEVFVKADSEEEAIEKFERSHGKDRIYQIEEL